MSEFYEIAKKNLDEWNEITGFVKEDTGYYHELLSVIEDAVRDGYAKGVADTSLCGWNNIL